MTSDDLLKLLAAKHSGDVFVPECKSGASYVSKGVLKKMDAWVMPRSWARPAITAYEIKVTRSDFLSDDKWPKYRQFCNCLYFVSPWGLIMPDELPADVGLIWASKNGARLFTKKKAPHRDVVVPENVFRYVLMCRAQIGSEVNGQPNAEYWADWLKTRDLNSGIGYRVSVALREEISERITKAETENKRLKSENDKLSEVKKILEEIGVHIHTWHDQRTIKEKLDRFKSGIPKQMKRHLVQAAKDLRSTVKMIESIESESETSEAIE